MAKKSEKNRRSKRNVPKPTRHNVRNLSKNNWDIIERIWAENGLVYFLDKEGNSGFHTVKEAALRARSINLMPYPAWQRATVQKLVESIVEACKEAQAQRSDPQKSKKVAAITNMVDGKMPDGSPMREITDEDELVQSYMFQFATLDESSIRAVLRDDRLDRPRKERLLMEIHRQNMASIDVTPL